MENFNKCYIEFEDHFLNNLLVDLRDCFVDNQNTFAHTCKMVYKIWKYCKGNYFKAKDNEYYNSYKLLEKFGLDKKAVNRYKNCYEKFIYDYETDKLILSGKEILCKVCVKLEFADFSPSKLFEMLSLTLDTALELVEKQLLKPTMTVKQIREYIKSLKDGTDKAEKVVEDTTEINEEDIPLVYDPKQEYEYSYFESKTKNQLLNIVWELQKAYQKLKGEKKNVKQSNK